MKPYCELEHDYDVSANKEKIVKIVGNPGL
jgi:hypothetical protein